MMTEETKAKIRASHLKRIQANPAVAIRLKTIANDPAMKAARSIKMKAKWADPEWRKVQLAKLAARNGAKTAETPAVITPDAVPVKRKRIITDAQKLKYADARKAKRAAGRI